MRSSLGLIFVILSFNNQPIFRTFSQLSTWCPRKLISPWTSASLPPRPRTLLAREWAPSPVPVHPALAVVLRLLWLIRAASSTLAVYPHPRNQVWEFVCMCVCVCVCVCRHKCAHDLPRRTSIDAENSYTLVHHEIKFVVWQGVKSIAGGDNPAPPGGGGIPAGVVVAIVVVVLLVVAAAVAVVFMRDKITVISVSGTTIRHLHALARKLMV